MKSKISAVIIDTYKDKSLPKLAIEKSLECSMINKVYTFSDEPFFEGAEFIKIPLINSNKDYERIILFDLPKVVSSNILIIQWDGFTLNPTNWRDEFCDYDYIGAPHYVNSVWQVGNGGFSYRSSRLIETLYNLMANKDWESQSLPEDLLISNFYKSQLEELGIDFAPLDLARTFAYQEGELNNSDSIFGFHAIWNFPLFFSEKGLLLIAEKIMERIHNFRVLVIFLENCRNRGYKNLFKESVNALERNVTLNHKIDASIQDEADPWGKRFINVMIDQSWT